MAAGLVHLERGLGGIEDQRHVSRGAEVGAEQCCGLLGDAGGVAGEVHLVHHLPAGGELLAAEAVGEAARLHLAVAGGRGVEASAGLDDRLLDARSLAAGKELMVPHRRERAEPGGHTGNVHAGVGSQQEIDLAIQRHRERVDDHRGRVGRGDAGHGREPHPADGAARRRACDAHRQSCRILEAGRVGALGAAEAPRPVDEHADAASLVLELADVVDAAVLDRHRLDASLHHAAVGIHRPGSVGGVQQPIGDVMHGRSPLRWAPPTR